MLNVLASFTSPRKHRGPYLPLATLADALVKAKVIEIHHPYQGKNPRNPRYMKTAQPA